MSKHKDREPHRSFAAKHHFGRREKHTAIRDVGSAKELRGANPIYYDCLVGIVHGLEGLIYTPPILWGESMLNPSHTDFSPDRKELIPLRDIDHTYPSRQTLAERVSNNLVTFNNEVEEKSEVSLYQQVNELFGEVIRMNLPHSQFVLAVKQRLIQASSDSDIQRKMLLFVALQTLIPVIKDPVNMWEARPNFGEIADDIFSIGETRGYDMRHSFDNPDLPQVAAVNRFLTCSRLLSFAQQMAAIPPRVIYFVEGANVHLPKK